MLLTAAKNSLMGGQRSCGWELCGPGLGTYTPCREAPCTEQLRISKNQQSLASQGWQKHLCAPCRGPWDPGQ